MKIKKIFGIAVISIMIIIIAGRLAHTMAYKKAAGEFISVYTDNKEAFKYIADTIKTWDEHSGIYFDYYDGNKDFGDCVTSNNPLFESTMLDDEKFYESIKSLYEARGIRRMSLYDGNIIFVFFEEIEGQYDTLIYGTGIEWCPCRYRLAAGWTLEMRPEHHDHSYEVLEEWLEYFKWW